MASPLLTSEKKIGTLKHIRRYPFKSMKGEDLSKAYLSPSGIPGDRRFAFIDENAERKSFPWMTARQKYEMLLFVPSFKETGNQSGVVEVRTPEGKVFLADDPALEEFLEKRFGYSLKLKHDEEAGCFDSMPLSLFGLATLKALEAEVGMELERERFRANLYAEWDSGEPYFEDTLVGRELALGYGGARIKVIKRNQRCAIPTLSPVTTKPSPVVLRNIERNHDGCVGVYCEIPITGEVSVNDPIFLLQ